MSDSACQLNVFRHDSYSLRMDGTQISVLEHAYHVGLCSLLDRVNGTRLESQIALVLSGYLSHKSLEGQSSD